MNDLLQNAYKYLEDSKKKISQNEAEVALFLIRKGFEDAIKVVCEKCALDDYKDDIYIMIQKLFENGLINEKQNAILHKTRMKGNYGVHNQNNEAEVTIDDANEGLYFFEQSLEVFESILSDSIKVNNLRKDNNNPMVNPNYYEGSRCRYYGEWSDCFTRESLLSKKSYNNLKKMANNGDIQSMLDIAAGFLPKNIMFGPYQMINMPYSFFKEKGYKIQDHTYAVNKLQAIDSRYYYWIGKAVSSLKDADTPPLKYIATAILEYIKYSLLLSVNILDYHYGNADWSILAKSMFNENIPTVPIKELCEILIYLIEKYSTEIISPVHEENTIENIKYLYFVSSTLEDYEKVNKNIKPEQITNVKLVIDPSDLNCTASKLVEKYAKLNSVCEKYYSLIKPKSDALNRTAQENYTKAKEKTALDRKRYLTLATMSEDGFYKTLAEYELEKKYDEAFDFIVENAKKDETAAEFLNTIKNDVQSSYYLPCLIYFSNLDDADALFSLGKLYLEGKKVEADSQKGLELLNKAVSLGNTQAIYQLGVCYKEGIGVEKNTNTAIGYLKEAAEKGNSKAYFVLGQIFEQDKKIDDALECYKRASELGDSDAERERLRLEQSKYANQKSFEKTSTKAQPLVQPSQPSYTKAQSNTSNGSSYHNENIAYTNKKKSNKALAIIIGLIVVFVLIPMLAVFPGLVRTVAERISTTVAETTTLPGGQQYASIASTISDSSMNEFINIGMKDALEKSGSNKDDLIYTGSCIVDYKVQVGEEPDKNYQDNPHQVAVVVSFRYSTGVYMYQYYYYVIEAPIVDTENNITEESLGKIQNKEYLAVGGDYSTLESFAKSVFTVNNYKSINPILEERNMYFVNTRESNLILRAGIGTENDGIASVPNGARVNIEEFDSGWAYVDYNGVKGWASTEYLRLGNPNE